MNLTYRGIAYTSPAAPVSLQTTTTAHLGQYRGTSYAIQLSTMPLSPQVTGNLKYRGAYYRPILSNPRNPGWAPA